jgi:hypothetical protein
MSPVHQEAAASRTCRMARGARWRAALCTGRATSVSGPAPTTQPRARRPTTRCEGPAGPPVRSAGTGIIAEPGVRSNTLVVSLVHHIVTAGLRQPVPCVLPGHPRMPGRPLLRTPGRSGGSRRARRRAVPRLLYYRPFLTAEGSAETRWRGPRPSRGPTRGCGHRGLQQGERLPASSSTSWMVRAIEPGKVNVVSDHGQMGSPVARTNPCSSC